MAASYDALDPEHRELLLAMLDSPPGRSPSATSPTRCAGTPAAACPKAPVDLVDRLADHFVRVMA